MSFSEPEVPEALRLSAPPLIANPAVEVFHNLARISGKGLLNVIQST